jgi:asparagine synthase (glutamine-hydrolysing)
MPPAIQAERQTGGTALGMRSCIPTGRSMLTASMSRPVVTDPVSEPAPHPDALLGDTRPYELLGAKLVILKNWLRPCDDREILAREEEHSFRLEISSTALDQIYYRTGTNSTEVTDDLRRLVGPTDTLDERAIYSLLQFGAAIPPLSPWKSIRRAVPGRITTFRDLPLGVEETDFRSEEVWDQGSRPVDLNQQISMVLAALDNQLLALRHRHRLIVLFSGGVDSGLLAARAAALGLKDTLLVNYSFGPEDPESLLAEQMAKHLGLSFQRILDIDSGDDVEDVLTHAGSDYRTPFGDHSTVPTYRLVRSVIRAFGSEFAILDGTGADGAFGLFGRARQWRRMNSIPVGLLRFGSQGYKYLRLWRKESRGEYLFRLLRRASQHRFPMAAIAQNALAGIAYNVPKHISDEVESLAFHWLRSISPPGPRLQLTALDISLVCACIFAQKSKSLFAASTLDVTYPYLSRPISRLAFASENWTGANEEAKWLLKAALAQHVPSEMVYRPKSGFVATIAAKFKSEAFLAGFDKLIAGKSQLSPFLEKKFLQNIRVTLAAKGRLPAQTNNAVWVMVFVSEWLEQVSSRAKDVGLFLQTSADVL